MISTLAPPHAVDVYAGLRAGLDRLKAEGLYRDFVACSYLAEDRGHALHQGRRIQVWCTNDYLGMSQHPEVMRAQIASTLRHGTGNGGSRNIAGTKLVVECHPEGRWSGTRSAARSGPSSTAGWADGSTGVIRPSTPSSLSARSHSHTPGAL